MYQKNPAYRSKAWMQAVASLPCVLCGKHGQTQPAHRNEGKGMGMKTHDCWTAALCYECHSRIDQGAHLTREDRRSLIDGAILLTLSQLANAGLVGPK